MSETRYRQTNAFFFGEPMCGCVGSCRSMKMFPRRMATETEKKFFTHSNGAIGTSKKKKSNVGQTPAKVSQ
jgi:hypothetical protein